MENDSELKCILYECIHAEDRTLKREEDRYHAEIRKQVEMDEFFDRGGDPDDWKKQEEFKEMIEKAKAMKDDEENFARRNIQRKPDKPMANAKDFTKENERMGIKKETDLIDHLLPP